jgi:poly-gamma-glutamate capsule biosynthesis protein CapA/YwtB (metallophosphatase superfamily)
VGWASTSKGCYHKNADKFSAGGLASFEKAEPMAPPSEHISLFLSGDVMTGRGIDQILPYPCEPQIHEPWVRNARTYVALAEEASGPIARPVDFEYVWGEALGMLDRQDPDGRIINLETAVTISNDHWPYKGINYRMHPANITLLSAARIDIVGLANNHVLDWGFSGLEETLVTLERAGIVYAGAGRDRVEAQRPAVLDCGDRGRVLVFACGLPSSGIPDEWAATAGHAGIFLLPDLGKKSALLLMDLIAAARQREDLVVVSIHWGGNWGFAVPPEQREFAHRLIEEGGVDLVHGHSSHHAKGLEVYGGKLIIYGAGDLINDYEGISGYEEFRANLSLMYFVRMEPGTGKLAGLRMAPMRMANFRLHRASLEDSLFLAETLNREGRYFGSGVGLAADGLLDLRWL